MKQFSMRHLFFATAPELFSEATAPDWLRYGGKEGSTMCNRWFWNNRVMNLEVGESIKTDFQEILRIE